MKVLKMKPSDKGILKVLIIDIKEAVSEQTIASIFWKVMVYIAFISLAIYDFEIAKWLSMLASVLFVGLMLDGGFEDDKVDWFWVPLAIFFWISIVFFICIYIIYFLVSRFYRYIIKPFNTFLNSLGK